MKVAFIGLGIMGSRMASRLVDAGINLSVYNRNKEVYSKFLDKNVFCASSVGECTHEAGIVITMLSTPEVVKEVAFGAEGFVQKMSPGTLWVDCSTVNPSFSKASGAKANAHRVQFVDAPVAGSSTPAERGELVFFAGGDKNDVARLEPHLLHMGRKVIHTGSTSSGTAMKAVINYLLAHAMVAFSEAVALGKKSGLSDDLLFDVLPTLPVAAPFLQMKAGKIRKENFEVEFPLEWMVKDVDLVIQTASELNVSMPVAEVLHRVYQKSRQHQEMLREDFSAIYKVVQAT